MEKERTEAEGNSLVDLETARLVLTPVTEEHIDPICAHFTKEVVTYMVPGPAKERGDMEAGLWSSGGPARILYMPSR